MRGPFLVTAKIKEPPRLPHGTARARQLEKTTMNKILEQLTEPPNTEQHYFIPPRQVLSAQQWLKQHGLSSSHCLLLANLYARWVHEPNRPISLSDQERLYGGTRRTVKKLLTVMAVECGCSLELAKHENGAATGYLLRRGVSGGACPREAPTAELPDQEQGSSNQRPSAVHDGASATGELPERNPPSSSELLSGSNSRQIPANARSGVSSRKQGGCSTQHRRVSPTEQGGELQSAATRTFSKNPSQEPEQNQDLCSPRSRAQLHRVQWDNEEERQFQAALDTFAREQAKRDGMWELEPEDRQQLLEAAKRLHGASQRGEAWPSLQRRLADALDRAEAHAWALGRPVRHSAGQHFGAYLRPEPLDAVRPLSEFKGNSNCHDEAFPAVSWCPQPPEWRATHEYYCGETFPIVNGVVEALDEIELAEERRNKMPLEELRLVETTHQEQATYHSVGPVLDSPLPTTSQPPAPPAQLAPAHRPQPVAIGLSGFKIEEEKRRQLRALSEWTATAAAQ
jgi:hypothetical protein